MLKTQICVTRPLLCVNVFEQLMAIIEELNSRTEDEKHVRTKMPTGSGSLFCNCKHFFSILLLALADANHCFFAVDVGAVGKSSDSNVSKNSNIGRKLESNQLGIQRSRSLPNDENGKCMSFVLVGDEGFRLVRRRVTTLPE